MKVQYLGTAAAEGIPAIFCTCDTCKKARAAGGRNIRRRSGCVINDTILIDIPPDIYPVSVEFNIDLANITDVFITHSHSDHFTPAEILMRMPGCYAILPENTPPLNLYGNEETKRLYYEAIDREFNQKEVDFILYHMLSYYKPVELSTGVIVTHLPALHKLDEKAGIFLIEEKSTNKKFLYGHDTGWFPEGTWEYLKDKKLDAISLDCTSCRYLDGSNHMGIGNVVQTIDKLKEMGCTDSNTTYLINHFSHNGHATYEELCELAKPHNLIVSYDGMILSV